MEKYGQYKTSHFLKEKIYPAIINNKIVHDEYFEKIAFPTKRESRQFVGQAFDQDDNELHPEHAEML